MFVFINHLKSKISKYSSLKNISILLLIVMMTISYFYFANSETKTTKSQLGGLTLDRQTIQGGTPVSQEYQAALTKADNQRVQDAITSGTSAVPTVVLSNSHQEPPVLINEQNEEPAIKTPKLQLPQSPILLPSRTKNPIPSKIIISQPPQPDRKTTEKIVQHIENLRPSFQTASIVQLNNNATNSTELIPPQTNQSNTPTIPISNINLPPSGTVYYGQLITQVNSDAPGPVLAQILQGPFKGSKLIGSFEVGHEAATLKFNKMSNFRDQLGNLQSQSIPVNAIAVDSQHIGTSLTSAVDRHLIEKIGFGFIAGFAKGLSNVLPRINKTTIESIDGNEKRITETTTTRDVLYSATGQAIDDTGTLLFNEFGKRPRTIIVESGTEIGVLFY